MKLSTHYKNVSNSNGTELTIDAGKYLSVGKNGTDIMIRGNGIVLAFNDWNSFINAIDYRKATYYHQDEA